MKALVGDRYNRRKATKWCITRVSRWPIAIGKGGDKAPIWVWGDVDLARKLVKWINKSRKRNV